jgi:catechol 2,3-dioxygenase-like lactoylglutathione lyase family enzyme
MLSEKDCLATIAVRDLNAGKRFYEGTLGLKPIAHEGEEAVTYKAGASKLLIYRSEYAGTNKATAVHWIVGPDIDRIARDLKAKGVVFEHYDLPGLKLEGDIHSAGSFKTAWFKDPDGNILSLVTG